MQKDEGFGYEMQFEESVAEAIRDSDSLNVDTILRLVMADFPGEDAVEVRGYIEEQVEESLEAFAALDGMGDDEGVAS